jgi:curved DNA-binding protein CbpA
MTDATSSSASSREPTGKLPSQNLTKGNYYERLRLRPGASVQEIRRAYRDLSKLYHPDTTELESALAVPQFQALNEAYATLSSPEKRLSYDYKIGYSRISVIQPQREAANVRSKFSDSAYLDPSDRPLSAGELFALFILGITFVGCLLLVVTISLTKGDVAVTQISPPGIESINAAPSASTAASAAASAADSSMQLFDGASTPELPQQPWLLPKAHSPRQNQAKSQIYPVFPPSYPPIYPAPSTPQTAPFGQSVFDPS